MRRLLPYLCGAALLAGCGEPEPSRSVVLIVSDTLRADALECYGGGAHTPNICGLAARGARFTRSYSNAPWTLPSVVSMMSGNYASQYARPLRDGRELLSFHIPDPEVLLAEALTAHGYDAFATFENPIASRSNVRQGLGNSPPDGTLAAELPASLGFDDSIVRYRKLVPTLRYLAGPHHNRFFVLYWFRDPHAAYSPPTKFRADLEAEASTLPRPIDFYAALGHGEDPETGGRKLRDVVPDLSAAEISFLHRLYLKEVESVDERVGYLLAALAAGGHDRDTVVAFTADHGEGFGEHGSYLHGETFHDELLHVPLILAGPGIPADRVIDEPVSHIDLMPTLADLTGVPCLTEPRGRSLVRLMRDGKDPELADRPHYVVNPLRAAAADALIQGRYKLITSEADRALELYDLLADPGERTNLAGSEPNVAKRLLLAARRIREENQRRRNAATPEEDLRAMQAADEETLRQLKALGYVE